ncbi:hypothetical protein DR864_09160 [Runella rosea]|uniref:Uncharacterized protein n=2 Tax=Runella rosea TaxID=2259595 RepID=A0A344TGW5_9BACT|nr:hypothetical protein DR864_09160 [Runella rosea]
MHLGINNQLKPDRKMARPKKQATTQEKKVLKDAFERLLERAELMEKVDISALPSLQEIENTLVKLTVMYVKAYNHAANTCNLPELDESYAALLDDSARRMIKSMLRQLSVIYP